MSATLILFGAGIFATISIFVVWLGIDVWKNYSKGEPPPVDTSYPKLADDLNDRVNIALNAGNIQDPSALTSNFNDRLNGSNNFADQTKSNLPPMTTGIDTPKLPPLSVKAKTFPDGINPASVQNSQPTLVASNEVKSDAADRLNERYGQVRRGNDVQPLPQIYDIDEVTPLGVVGDQKRREVLFYSPVTKQTFSAPLGTKFRNGSLEDAAGDGNTVEGVRFRRDDNGNLETRSWARTAQGKTSDSSEQPVLAKEPVLNPIKPRQARRQ